jgi:N-formylmaleamate deformylase
VKSSAKTVLFSHCEGKMAEFSEGKVTANGIEQHYYRAENPGKLSVVLLHGVTDNGMCWVAVARALREAYDVIMLDARGHGKSEAPTEGYGSLERAADVAAFVEEMGLDRPVLFGHSMGADTAITAAEIYPGLFRGVILEDPPWREMEGPPPAAEEVARRAEAWRTDIEQRQSSMTVEDLVAQAQRENPQWPEVELEPWAESKLQVSPNVASVFGSLRQNWRQSVGSASCPILLITGDPERGGIVSPEIAEEVSDLWQNGRLAHVSGTGHCVHRDQFAPVMRAVQEFLSELAE